MVVCTVKKITRVMAEGYRDGIGGRDQGRPLHRVALPTRTQRAGMTRKFLASWL